jgi:hypothetical protein
VTDCKLCESIVSCSDEGGVVIEVCEVFSGAVFGRPFPSAVKCVISKVIFMYRIEGKGHNSGSWHSSTMARESRLTHVSQIYRRVGCVDT